MDQLGQPRDHRPRKSFWARFSEQETGPQKVLVGLAGTVTALVTTVGGGYALVNVLNDGSEQVATDTTRPPEPSDPSDPGESATSPPEPAATNTHGVTLKPGQTLVVQGSKEADELVHQLVDDPGARTTLDVVILGEPKEWPNPQWIMRLWYNCEGLPEGEPPGADLCSSVMLVFDDAGVPPPYKLKRPLRIELKGIWADNLASGAGYGAEGLEIFPVPASG